MEINKEKSHTPEKIASHISSYPLIIYLAGLVLGLTLDNIFRFRVIPETLTISIGFLLFIFSTLLIFWALQSSYWFLKKWQICDIKEHKFKRGPYKFSRNPVYLGLGLLMLGFGFLINSLFVISWAIIAFLVIHFVIIKREEAILAIKYKDEYDRYKKSVRCWM